MTYDSGTEGRDVAGHLLIESSGIRTLNGENIDGFTVTQEIGKVCADLTLGDDDTCFERRVVTGGDTSTDGCWTDSNGLATWKDDCGEGDVAGVLSVSEHPPIVTGDCNDEMLAEVGVLISDGMYDSLDVGGHLLIESSGMATGPQCGAVVTIAASDLPSLKDAAGEDVETLGRSTTGRWPSFLGLGFATWYKCYMDELSCIDNRAGMATGGVGDVYGYVITDDSDDTADDGTDARSTSGRIQVCEVDDDCDGGEWCERGYCVGPYIDGMYFAVNFVGLTCDAIHIEVLMCDDAVIVEAHAEHDCGEEGHWGCPLCITTGIVDDDSANKEIKEETPDSPLPGFTGIMTMVAMLSAVMIRRRRDS